MHIWFLLRFEYKRMEFLSLEVVLILLVLTAGKVIEISIHIDIL